MHDTQSIPSLPQEITFYRKVDLEQKNQGQRFNAAGTVLQAAELFSGKTPTPTPFYGFRRKEEGTPIIAPE